MKTIIVTGGAGFIGCNFVRLLLEETDLKVVVLDKLTYAGSLLNLKGLKSEDRLIFIEGDIADPDCVHHVFKNHTPQYLLNFAAESHVDRSIDGPRIFIETNVLGTFTLLNEAKSYFSELGETEKNAFRFLHVSTDEVYGSLGSTGAFSEETPYAPNSPYSASKAGADHLVRAYYHTYKLPTLITNCSNNYGPFQFPEKLIPLSILNALEGKNLPIYGDGGNIRDWIYVEDHCRGVLKVLLEGRLGEKYNLGGYSEQTNLQVVDSICQILDELDPCEKKSVFKEKKITTHLQLKTFVKDRPGHDRRYAIDASKVKNELNWVPKNKFSDGIRKTVQWYLSHLDWCSEIQKGNYNRERLGLKK